MNPDEPTAVELLIAEAGGREKVSAEFLARQIDGNSDNPDRCNAVMDILSDAARDEKFQLVTDTISATDPERVGVFVGLLMLLAEEPVRRLVESQEPVGIETLASVTGESVETLQEATEPFLIRTGYVQKTARGRIATTKARALFEEETQ